MVFPHSHMPLHGAPLLVNHHGIP